MSKRIKKVNMIHETYKLIVKSFPKPVCEVNFLSLSNLIKHFPDYTEVGFYKKYDIDNEEMTILVHTTDNGGFKILFWDYKLQDLKNISGRILSALKCIDNITIFK